LDKEQDMGWQVPPAGCSSPNAEQVEKIRRIMAEFDIHQATPQEARRRLGLPHPAPKVAAMAV